MWVHKGGGKIVHFLLIWMVGLTRICKLIGNPVFLYLTVVAHLLILF